MQIQRNHDHFGLHVVRKPRPDFVDRRLLPGEAAAL